MNEIDNKKLTQLWIKGAISAYGSNRTHAMNIDKLLREEGIDKSVFEALTLTLLEDKQAMIKLTNQINKAHRNRNSANGLEGNASHIRFAPDLPVDEVTGDMVTTLEMLISMSYE